jgi:dethiobiotin synthase
MLITPASRRQRAPGLFITGTGTDVGKTLVTALIGAWLLEDGAPVKLFKPVQSGVNPRRPCGRGTDPGFYRHFIGPGAGDAVVEPLYSYRPPQAPSLAAAADKLPPPQIEKIIRKCYLFEQQKCFTVVEGAGGVLAPLNRRQTVADLAQRLRYPALVVSSPVLGTINHTVLTVQELQRRSIRVWGVVFSGVVTGSRVALDRVAREIERFSGAPVLGAVPEWPARKMKYVYMKSQPEIKALRQALAARTYE